MGNRAQTLQVISQNAEGCPFQRCLVLYCWWWHSLNPIRSQTWKLTFRVLPKAGRAEVRPSLQTEASLTQLLTEAKLCHLPKAAE